MNSKRILTILLLVNILISAFFPILHGIASNDNQAEIPAMRAQLMLEKMTPEEKVGQLFLVQFTGSSADETTQIFDLIVNYNVGGVVLQNANDNFTPAPDTISNAHNLISELQSLVWQKSQGNFIDLNTNSRSEGNYVPLFVGISQEGDGYPNDQILNGLTPLPDLMAIGATWQPDLSRQVGEVSGQELSQIGFNLFLGPSLDVLVTSGISGGGGLGARSFGGDPYWVAKMGQEYISGMHEGSNGRLAIIAKHFPGKGSTDRSASEEVSTVRKSLEQLKQIELAPFFEVTEDNPGANNTTDGLLVSHIRYQGFQGNIRATTRPVSFDPQALSQILALTQFSTWHENGGLLVSDDLGSEAVRRFYDPANQSFSARIVMRDAFLAGNDLLYVGNIISSDAVDNYASIVQSLEFFTQKYNEDAAFAQRVDESAKRILTMKYRIYEDFTFSKVLPLFDPSNIGISQSVTFEVARQSATLISPDAIELDSLVPTPPGVNDRILFLTDTRIESQCEICPENPAFSKESLPDAIYRLYGPQAGGLVKRSVLLPYSFDDLKLILQGGEGNPALESELNIADWVIISLLDSTPDQSSLDTLRSFFFERQDLLRNKKVILFAFNAPYFLDATDISKLTAYYGLYSKSLPFVEVAARILFQELNPVGSLPVSVSGIGYDLLSATAPNPDQVIDLSLDLPIDPEITPEATFDATATPFFKVGETIPVKTGIILDHNNRQVPDGTGVRFTLTSNLEGKILQIVDTITSQGIARTAFSINQPGLVEIRAMVEPLVTSVVLQLDITSDGISVTVVAPTQASQEATIVPVDTPTPQPVKLTSLESGYPGLAGWFLMVLIISGMSWLAFYLGARYYSIRWGTRWVLCILLSGLGAYNYLVIGIPSGRIWIQSSGLIAVVELVFIMAGLGWLCAYFWTLWSMKQRGDQADKE
ncbi:MAG: glycoside hydrolase family 3 N-terminal domain-containing protein [Chloroflexota bacterium]